MNKFCRVAAVLVLSVGLFACNPSGSDSIAVIDLSEIASATGEDVRIRARAEAGRNDLMVQLQALAGQLDQQIAAERTRLGDKPSEEDAAKFQQLSNQARMQVNQAQQQAQQQATRMETDLVGEFRAALLPIADAVANKKGLKIILSTDVYVFWNDPAVDITQAVIDEWKKQNPAAASPTTEPAADSVEEPAVELPTTSKAPSVGDGAPVETASVEDAASTEASE